ncbi:aminotransferase class III-fold pyridoxal phosphate-dependent enzyme [Robiginitalea sp. M366]|uniref:aspartate aminotransferase family protein n=1 Tax=Robiginitalea aestuariiviva TaxID=3036903 RepID=UPI00240D55A8|nr:aminotransferase class III-fold pyridoxal phosphate-dependent enzyme [Robiginitalea aestuariiviva]MDG1573222.1 aminotransferase class III-fold pyridoxal phosphate-dependent enzyme [Robiginitalea aestuariiviva]
MNPDFQQYQAQTGPHPLGLEIDRASGSYLYDTRGKAYLDFIAGVSACTLGHCHPAVVQAVQEQAARYMHVMVYGEFALEPAVTLCRELAAALPAPLESTYLVNSGTEAMEGALKLARRVTGRSRIVAARNAYHGNTLGSLSLMDYETRKAPFRPLIPDIRHLRFNHLEDLNRIDRHTAAVVLETIQGGAGFILPEPGYLQAVKRRCEATGALLILDEIQPGFGRTGSLFAFTQHGCVPDVVVMGKGMASGLPVGAFTASREHMKTLSESPQLGHITTFGGNPVVAAAALATLRELRAGWLMEQALAKEQTFRAMLAHPLISEVRGRGLMLALIMEDAQVANYLVTESLKRGLLLFWLLFEPRAVRISPPLTLSEAEIQEGCTLILELLEAYPGTGVN